MERESSLRSAILANAVPTRAAGLQRFGNGHY
jgi:hypothetical protein